MTTGRSGRTFERVLERLRSKGLGTQLLRGGAASLLLKAGNAAFTLGVAAALARALGPEGYGIYAFVFSILTILSIPAQGGIPKLIVREVAKYQVREEWGLMRGVLRRANQTVFALSLLLVAGSIVVVSFFRPAVLSDTHVLTFGWGLLLVPLIALGNVRGATLRGLRQVVRGQLPEMFVRPGLLFLLAVIAAVAFTIGPQHAMALHVGAAAAAFLVGVVMLRRAIPAEVRAAEPRYETRAWAASVIPFALLATAALANQQTDVLMLGLLSTNANVGLYKMAVQASGLVPFALQAMNMVIAPHITRLYHQNDQARLQRMITTSARLILLAALPAALLLIFFGEPILGLLAGAEYRSAHVALAILCVGQLVNAALGPVGLLLNMTGHERDTLLGFAIAAACNITLNLILIPRAGIEGAAAAGAISMTVWNVILYVHVRRKLQLRTSAFGALL